MNRLVIFMATALPLLPLLGDSKADAKLFTPGPLTTTDSVLAAMNQNLGSRDTKFSRINQEVLEMLGEIADIGDSHVAVPLQGSGTFVVEAMLGTLVPKDGHLLILANGVYGQRMKEIMDQMGRTSTVFEERENHPIEPHAVEHILFRNPSITHVAIIHCETTTGLLNPLKEIAAIARKYKKPFLVDAMSSFGAVPLSAQEIGFDALVASSNKNLQGVPGVGFAFIRKTFLDASEGNSHSFSLDLFSQNAKMQALGQWRFTPPTHSILALHQALRELRSEGGVEGRYQRLQRNCDYLVDTMITLGFDLYLDRKYQAPIINTFRYPKDYSNFHFPTLYEFLKSKNLIIYPGKLTTVDTFRIGCIGDLKKSDFTHLLTAIEEHLEGLEDAEL